MVSSTRVVGKAPKTKIAAAPLAVAEALDGWTKSKVGRHTFGACFRVVEFCEHLSHLTLRPC